MLREQGSGVLRVRIWRFRGGGELGQENGDDFPLLTQGDPYLPGAL